MSRAPSGYSRGGNMCTEHSPGEMERREFLRIGGAALAGAVLLGTASSSGGRVLAQTRSSLAAEFGAAAREYGAPRELLLAIGYVNTRWEMPPPRVGTYREGDIHGRGAYGIMQLVQNPWENTLGEAARLTGLSEERLKNDRAANIRGGAAVLAGMQGSDRPQDLNGWQEALSEYGGIDLYATEVYETLQSGASATISTGECEVGAAGRGGAPVLNRPAHEEGRLQEGRLETSLSRELHEQRSRHQTDRPDRDPHRPRVIFGDRKLVQESVLRCLRALRRGRERQGDPVRAQRGYSLARGKLAVQQEEHRYRALGLCEQPRGVPRQVPHLGEALSAPREAVQHTRGSQTLRAPPQRAGGQQALSGSLLRLRHVPAPGRALQVERASGRRRSRYVNLLRFPGSGLTLLAR